MFLKPFKVKSNTTVKGSDRCIKQLTITILKYSLQYAKFLDEDLSNLIPNKGDFTSMKISTHSGDHVTIYFNQKSPLFFECDKNYYPTVYTMWKSPNILARFTTHAQVLEKLNSGADLMLPGVITEDWNVNTFGKLKKGDVCCVDLTDNKSVVAIGKTALSSEDMFLSGKRGKGVIILHSYLDHLWAAGEKNSLPIVEIEEKMGGLDLSENLTDQIENSNQIEPIALITNDTADSEKIISNNGADAELKLDAETAIEENADDTQTEVEKMDNLLTKCFLQAWKTSAKKAQLPLLISTFYKSHMMPACPRGLSLDVKKSSFKKISKFIRQMQQFGIIEVKELSSGVESIVAVNFAHPDIRGYQVEEVEEILEPTVEIVGTDVKYEFPEIVDLFVIGADMMPFFKFAKKSKGTAITVTEIRQIIKNYVTENQLQSTEVRSLVNMDPILSQCLNTAEAGLRWDDLMTRFVTKMKPAYQMIFPNKLPTIKKGKLDPIELSVAQRAANKKVTLVYNLELFGINPKEFAHSVQIGVAASTSISTAVNRKEGHEFYSYFFFSFLDDYKVPRRFIKGLELAPKSGKKK
uniref:Uncharacterized protein n=1 Tax=Strigamia maritima TaxID=126957 RepID=T1J5Q9_STRMM